MRRSVLALVVSLAGLAYAACTAFALSRMGGLGLIVLRMADRALEFSPATPYLGLAALADAAIWARFISQKRGFALASALLYGAAAPFALSEPALMAGPLALALAALADFLRPAAAAADSAAAALIGVVVFGLVTGRLPFVP